MKNILVVWVYAGDKLRSFLGIPKIVLRILFSNILYFMGTVAHIFVPFSIGLYSLGFPFMTVSHRIHGTGSIFTYIYLIFIVNVGRYYIPYMDPMGIIRGS